MDTPGLASSDGGAARARVVVVGAGPAALAAVRTLALYPSVETVVVAPGGTSDFLAGALQVATGDAPKARFRSRVSVAGVRLVDAVAETVSATGVLVNGEWIGAQAVIAAPGLALVDVAQEPDSAGPPDMGRVFPFWDLDGAERAAPAVAAMDGGIISIVIGSPLYRCPPAPYGLAMRLAEWAEQAGRQIRIRLTTPEKKPLAVIGSGVSEFLDRACVEVGVEVHYDWQPDLEALEAGEIVGPDGERLDTDLALVVPPHRISPLLAEVADPDSPAGALVAVDANGRAANGVFVAGAAVASPFPRATSPAVVSGVNAATGALVSLGFDVEQTAALPEPDCFVDRGAGDYSRIQISYPDGRPPSGAPRVVISEPAPAATVGFDEARAGWLALCGE